MDIVERLRLFAKDDASTAIIADNAFKRADEIERLREVLKELEWQLKNQLYDAAYETVIHTLWPQLKEKE